MANFLPVQIIIIGILSLNVCEAGESGICSWYGAEGEIPQGWPTASGVGFDRFEMASAHKTLPFGILVRVKNGANGKTVDVRINDRGPFIAGRILDLTFSAFGFLEDRDVGLIRNCSYVVIDENGVEEPQSQSLPKLVNHIPNELSEDESGICSWYGAEGEIPQGWPTASGEGFDRFDMTSAHKTLPFGTIVRIKNGANGRTIEVRINDRGPFIDGRILDLTYESFGLLDNRDIGLIQDCSFVIVGRNYTGSDSDSDSEFSSKSVSYFPSSLHQVTNKIADESGICSWYGAEGEIPPGWPTASGEGFDRFEMAAAHKTLPFGTVIRVRNGANQKTVDVRINDRGPFISGRIVDLTYAAFGILDYRAIGLIQDCSYVILEEKGLYNADYPNSKVYTNTSNAELFPRDNLNSKIYGESYSQNKLVFSRKDLDPKSDFRLRQVPNIDISNDYFEEETTNVIQYI